MKYINILMLFIASLSFSQNWNTNFEDAKKMAEKKEQNVILVFSGSDWCAPCIKLEKEVWSSQVFKNYAKEHYVLLKADFPRRKKNALHKDIQKQNNQLAERYNKNGYFPLVVVLNKNGDVLGQVGYNKMKPEDYINVLNSF
ncbi:thioredoxin family protein [Flavivirga amylovorans]|uniref:Thioredoxin family protein n=1 Tax=Flavivirga amylovorans TaxID=870486 RepID=A0ABT8X4A8_9FLAO|nr:thioredoxin family protein [Flavivirga amylovorans]MDO5988538.1 thioredoxin family protein [Flavivirga amylovorans]